MPGGGCNACGASGRGKHDLAVQRHMASRQTVDEARLRQRVPRNTGNSTNGRSLVVQVPTSQASEALHRVPVS